MPETPVNVAYARSESYRRRSLDAGKPLPRRATLVVSFDTAGEPFRRLMAVLDREIQPSDGFLALDPATGEVSIELGQLVNTLVKTKDLRGWTAYDFKPREAAYDRELDTPELVVEAVEAADEERRADKETWQDYAAAVAEVAFTGMRPREIHERFRDEIPDDLRALAGDTAAFARRAAPWMRERDRREREETARIAAEAAAWIPRHGSASLKRMHVGGYLCQDRYVAERAAQDLGADGCDVRVIRPGLSVSDRIQPSDPAMDLADAIRANGYPSATVVWTKQDDLQREAVAVDRYLGRFRIAVFLPNGRRPEGKRTDR